MSHQYSATPLVHLAVQALDLILEFPVPAPNPECPLPGLRLGLRRAEAGRCHPHYHKTRHVQMGIRTLG